MNAGDATHQHATARLCCCKSGMADFQPPSDFRASSGYRKISGINLAYRALEEATNISRWRTWYRRRRGK